MNFDLDRFIEALSATALERQSKRDFAKQGSHPEEAQLHAVVAAVLGDLVAALLRARG